jgi:hypothetical protein
MTKLTLERLSELRRDLRNQGEIQEVFRHIDALTAELDALRLPGWEATGWHNDKLVVFPVRRVDPDGTERLMWRVERRGLINMPGLGEFPTAQAAMAACDEHAKQEQP